MKNVTEFKKPHSNAKTSAFLGMIGVLFGACGVVLYLSLFTVREWEQAVVVQFGDIVGDPVTEAGIHFKLPWQTVQLYDKRLMRWDGNQTTAITRDRRTVNIDVTARWRISDARRFRETIGSERSADGRLNGIIESAVRDEIAKFELYEVVRSSNGILDANNAQITAQDARPPELQTDLQADELATLGAVVPRLRQETDGTYRAGRPIVLQGILSDARRRLEQINLGIELEDVLIKQLGYIREIESNVYAQMNAELQKIAAGFRSSGRERAEQRLGEMQRELAIIESSALERAQRIRGEAEAEATNIFAEAYNRSPEFFRFLRSLEASERVLSANTSLVVSTASPLFELIRHISTKEE